MRIQKIFQEKLGVLLLSYALSSYLLYWHYIVLDTLQIVQILPHHKLTHLLCKFKRWDVEDQNIKLQGCYKDQNFTLQASILNVGFRIDHIQPYLIIYYLLTFTNINTLNSLT